MTTQHPLVRYLLIHPSTPIYVDLREHISLLPAKTHMTACDQLRNSLQPYQTPWTPLSALVPHAQPAFIAYLRLMSQLSSMIFPQMTTLTPFWQSSLISRRRMIYYLLIFPPILTFLLTYFCQTSRLVYWSPYVTLA